MEKRLSYRDMQSVKSLARALDPEITKRNKLEKQITELAEEFRACKTKIDLLEAGIVKTTGFHVEQLVQKVIEPTGALDKNGKPVKVTKYKTTDIVTYDEAGKQYVINVPDATEDIQVPGPNASNYGNDYDLDKERIEGEPSNPEPLPMNVL